MAVPEAAATVGSTTVDREARTGGEDDADEDDEEEDDEDDVDEVDDGAM